MEVCLEIVRILDAKTRVKRDFTETSILFSDLALPSLIGACRHVEDFAAELSR